MGPAVTLAPLPGGCDRRWPMASGARCEARFEEAEMDYEQSLADVREIVHPLEVLVFGVLRGLDVAGADEETVATVQKALDRWFAEIGTEDAQALADVVETRLHELHERGAFDDAVKLVGRMSMIEAHIAHDALAESGVATRLRHETLPASEFPEPPTQVELWIKPRDLARGKRVLAEMAQKADETVVCPSCGEENPANFTTCWNCNAALEG